MELLWSGRISQAHSSSERRCGVDGGEGWLQTVAGAPAVLAKAFARLLSGLATTLGEPLCVVELGAGSSGVLGLLAAELGDRREAVLRSVVAIDSWEPARQVNGEWEPGLGTASSRASVPQPGGPTVLLISGLYDRQPVHRVVMARKRDRLVLQELFVQVREAELRWVEGEPSDPAIAAYLHEHGVSLWEGQCAEVCLTTRPLHARVLAWLGLHGLVLVLTCGLAANRLYDARIRREGTLVARRGHLLAADVLREPGQWDITAQVNLDDLIRVAAEGGWESAPPSTAELLLELGGAEEPDTELHAADDGMPAQHWTELAAARRSLSAPGMSAELKLLAQGRGRVWSAYQAMATLPPRDA